jgi:hypothetical protein
LPSCSTWDQSPTARVSYMNSFLETNVNADPAEHAEISILCEFGGFRVDRRLFSL